MTQESFCSASPYCWAFLDHASERHQIPTDLPLALQTALNRIGITSLYSHQVEALACLRAGKDLSIATPTASGKTLCYNPAVFESCLSDRQTTALYLFPLKALALDQMKKLEQIVAALPPDQRPKLGRITGDVPIAERKKLFAPHPPQILAVSPDVLHYQLYNTKRGQNESWREFLRHLKWVVIDESHTYVGAFGAHFANLMRRLRMAIDSLGGNSDGVQYVFSSATIGNPQEMAYCFSGREATPEQLHAITRSGAQFAGRTTLCLAPSNAANPDACKIVLAWLRHGLSGIVFCNSRASVKYLLKLIQETSQRQGEDVAKKVAVFYASMPQERRREIIQKLGLGDIKVILSTSALEAGIDLPELDCCLLRGYPGSLMSLRQRIGRAGRQKPGLAIFLPVVQNALDYYYGKYPDRLLHGEVESASFNPDYPLILGKHLRCGCYESGVPLAELSDRFGSTAPDIADRLLQQQSLFLRAGQLGSRQYPHREVNLRGGEGGGSSVELLDKQSGESFEEMPLYMAHGEVFPGAIYMSQDAPGSLVMYRSESLDIKNGKAVLVRYSEDPNAFTKAAHDTNVSVLQRLVEPIIIPTKIKDGRLRLSLALGKITSSVTGYKLSTRQYEQTCTNTECGKYHKPLKAQSCPSCRRPTRLAAITTVKEEVVFEQPYQVEYEAPVFSVEMNEGVIKALQIQATRIRQELRKTYDDNIPPELVTLWENPPEFVALHSIEHQIAAALPLLVLSSSRDVSGMVLRTNERTIGYFFDVCEGGNGAAEAIFKKFSQFAAKAKSLAETCDCESGCPRCLIHHGCPHQNGGLHKGLGLFLLDAICN